MRLHPNAPLLPALPLLLAGIAACGTETVRLFTLDDAKSPAARDTYWEVFLWPSDSTPYKPEYRLRVDGQPVVWPADASPVVLQSQTLAPSRCNNLVGGAHVFELVGSGGKVALTTSPLQLTPGRTNELVIYGDSSDLRYSFFANTAAELDAIPPGSILARVLNLRTGAGGVEILVCTLAATSVSDCTPAKSGLAYGELLEQPFTRDVALAVACDPQGSTELCIHVPLSHRCASGTGQLTDPKSETIVLLDGADGKAFVAYEVSLSNCS